MSQALSRSASAVFQPDASEPVRALVVAGACGNVGFGKLGQFARLLAPKGVPIVALDPSEAVDSVKDRLREAYGDRFKPEQVDAILNGITVVRGGPSQIPAALRVGFVFEAIPERLPLKHGFYKQIRERDPEAFIFSATSGFPSTMLFEGLPGAERCGVMHPFFPHLTNKLWEVPTKGAVTGRDELKTIQKFLGGLGMNLVRVKDVPAFAADRIFCGMMLEAVRVHADLGISPAQVDDVCRKTFSTSPFYVHNLIAGANYLSAHCMELMQHEVGSSLFDIPEIWRPYIDDPQRKWPYERGEKCPPEQAAVVRQRMLGMLISLTAYMAEHDIAGLDALNFLCENALAFREGLPALIQSHGFEASRRLAAAYLSGQKITLADEVAPLNALDANRPGWGNIYVSTSKHDGVGLLSLKRLALSDTFLSELGAALDELNADDEVNSIVVAPDGNLSREFGHGADLQAFVPVLGDHAKALALIQRWKKTTSRFRGGPKPTVAALVGRVLGGSLELAASCDARIAGAGAKLQFPETTVGVIPGLGGCHLLHRFSRIDAWPEINAALLTGHGFSAEQAATWGLVGKVVPIPELPAASMKLAATLASSGSRPEFREDGATVGVDRNVATKNEAGVPLDSALRDLIVQTIQDANATTATQGSKIEEDRAAQSLAMSSSAIGVKAMLRGKPPAFENPL